MQGNKTGDVLTNGQIKKKISHIGNENISNQNLDRNYSIAPAKVGGYNYINIVPEVKISGYRA